MLTSLKNELRSGETAMRTEGIVEGGFVMVAGSARGWDSPTITFSVRDSPPVEPMSESELRSIAYADADGWRCFYPASRGHLTAAQARAVIRSERGLPPETVAEAEAAEFLLAAEDAWGHDVE
jgi:hypothetical protein